MAVNFKHIREMNERTQQQGARPEKNSSRFSRFRNSNQREEELVPAEFWLNIGYEVEVPTEDKQGLELDFVSLKGIALDDIEEVSTRSSNQKYANRQIARNKLLADIWEIAQELKPGETTVLDLQIQLRRVGEEKKVSEGENPYERKLNILRR